MGTRSLLNKIVVGLGATALVAAAAWAIPAHAGGVGPSRSQGPGRFVHFMPPDGTPPPSAHPTVVNLTYQGGPVMVGGTHVIPIFWQPTHLQSGATAAIDPQYNTLIRRFFTDFGGHASYNIVTQYFQTTGGPTRYIVNSSGLLKAVLVTAAYPAATGPCASNGITNCITDSQMRTEVQNVITVNGLPKGLGTYYPVFTDPNENSCFDNTDCYSPVAAPGSWKYCAYHSSLSLGGQEVIYANMPYIDSNATSVSGCSGGATHPNDAAFDDEGSGMSHEFIESVTDPLGTAWWDTGTGNEISDICNQQLAQVTYAAHPYIVQKQYSNASAACLPGGNQQVSLSPATGAAGAAATVSGTGFGASETVHLSFSAANGTVTSLGSTSSSGAGGISQVVNIPVGATGGTGTLNATGISPDDGAAANFTVSKFQPDALIGAKKTGPFDGNNLYNLTGANQTLLHSIKHGTAFTYWVEVQNDGNISDTFALKGPGAVAGFTVAYKVGTVAVTGGVKAGTYHHVVGAGGSFLLQVVVGVKSTTPAGKTFKPNVTVSSVAVPADKDAVVASAKAT